MLKKFKDLTEREILALAIQNEEEDGRIFGEFSDQLRKSYPATAQMFEEMRAEEAAHRDRLFATYRERFGDNIAPIRREDVKGVPETQAIVAGEAIGSERSAQAREADGAGGSAVLSQGCGPRGSCADA